MEDRTLSYEVSETKPWPKKTWGRKVLGTRYLAPSVET